MFSINYAPNKKLKSLKGIIKRYLYPTTQRMHHISKTCKILPPLLLPLKIR